MLELFRGKGLPSGPFPFLLNVLLGKTAALLASSHCSHFSWNKPKCLLSLMDVYFLIFVSKHCKAEIWSRRGKHVRWLPCNLWIVQRDLGAWEHFIMWRTLSRDTSHAIISHSLFSFFSDTCEVQAWTLRCTLSSVLEKELFICFSLQYYLVCSKLSSWLSPYFPVSEHKGKLRLVPTLQTDMQAMLPKPMSLGAGSDVASQASHPFSASTHSDFTVLIFSSLVMKGKSAGAPGVTQPIVLWLTRTGIGLCNL